MMSYKKKLVTTGLVLAAVLITSVCGMAGQKLDWSMTTVYMNSHPTVVNAWQPWTKEMAKLTDGQVNITYCNPNTLTPLKDHYDSTISGMIGIGGNDIGRNAGKFNLSTVMELPGLAPSAECGSLVYWDIYNKFPALQKEFKEVKILWMWASATFQLHTTKKPVKNRDDLKGLKIICWNRSSVDIMKSLGANAIMIPPTDSYLALERGMADGILCPLAPVVSFKISEAVKFTTVCDIFVTGFWAAMSHDLWKSLSPKIQKAFTDTTGAVMAKKSGVTLDQGAARDSKKLKKNGHTFIVLSDKERNSWLDATKPLREKWVKAMEKKGYKNPRALMKEAFSLSAKYAKITGRGFEQ